MCYKIKTIIRIENLDMSTTALSPEMQRVIDDTLRNNTIPARTPPRISVPLWWLDELKSALKLYNTETVRGLLLWPITFALITVVIVAFIRPLFILVNSKVSFGKLGLVYVLTASTASLLFYMQPNMKLLVKGIW